MAGDVDDVQDGDNVPDDPGNVQGGNVPDDGNDDVRDDVRDDEPPSLEEALREWEDGQKRSAFDDDPEPEDDRRDELAELQSQLESFENERGDFESAVNENLELARDAFAFHDEARQRIDEHDANRLVDHLASETGIDRHTIERELKMKLVEDSEFAELADARIYEPDGFNAAVMDFRDDLAERFPAGRDDYGMTSAVRLSRDVSVSRGEQGGFSEVNWARLGTHDFQAKAREVFAAHKAGTIRGKARKSVGSVFSTMPD